MSVVEDWVVGNVFIPKAGGICLLRDILLHMRILPAILRPFLTKPQFTVSSRKLAALDAIRHRFSWRETRAIMNFVDGAGRVQRLDTKSKG